MQGNLFKLFIWDQFTLGCCERKHCLSFVAIIHLFITVQQKEEILTMENRNHGQLPLPFVSVAETIPGDPTVLSTITLEMSPKITNLFVIYKDSPVRLVHV